LVKRCLVFSSISHLFICANVQQSTPIFRTCPWQWLPPDYVCRVNPVPLSFSRSFTWLTRLHPPYSGALGGTDHLQEWDPCNSRAGQGTVGSIQDGCWGSAAAQTHLAQLETTDTCNFQAVAL
jgi:hypothetical protein